MKVYNIGNKFKQDQTIQRVFNYCLSGGGYLLHIITSYLHTSYHIFHDRDLIFDLLFCFGTTESLLLKSRLQKKTIKCIILTRTI